VYNYQVIMSYVYLLTDKNKKCYVGKTENISHRLRIHKDTIKYKNNKCSSKELDSDFKYEILEEYGNEWDLAKGEQKWYDICKLKYGELLCNKIRPLNTPVEYREQHKDEIKENSKVYREQRKDEIKERNKVYIEQHKDQISEQKKLYREQHKDQISEQKKQYYEQHKDEIKEQNKQYREQHKDEIIELNKQYRSKKYICDCGGRYDKCSKSRHFKTNKHVEYAKMN